jgi:hypothetical protein
MRSNIEGVLLSDSTFLSGNRMGVLEQTLTGTLQLTADLPHVLALDPGGANRTVKMPASPQKGDWYWLINTADAAEIITVQDSAAAALVPPCTPTQNESSLLVYINATLGWRQFVAIGV